MQVPRITQPCPLRFGAAPQPGLDFCGQCRRTVHNLDNLDEARRRALVQQMGSICVAYTVPVRASRLRLAGTALAASLLGACATPAEVVDRHDDQVVPLEMETVTLLGGIDGADAAEWLHPDELQRPQAAVLPHVDNAQWLPTPKPPAK